LPAPRNPEMTVTGIFFNNMVAERRINRSGGLASRRVLILLKIFVGR
jgi:hypothetical protein